MDGKAGTVERGRTKAGEEWTRRTGQPQRLPTNATRDGARTPLKRAPGDEARKDYAAGSGGRTNANGNSTLPGFSFYRDDDRNTVAGSISYNGREFNFAHQGDHDDHGYHHGHGHGHGYYDDHWIWGGGCHYGYNYPYWGIGFGFGFGYGGYGYPYYGYSPYYSSIYDPYWYGYPTYYVPSYGYSYVSAYYEPAPAVVYEEPYVESYRTQPYVETYTETPSDSVIYRNDEPYVTRDKMDAAEPADDLWPPAQERTSADSRAVQPSQPIASTGSGAYSPPTASGAYSPPAPSGPAVSPPAANSPTTAPEAEATEPSAKDPGAEPTAEQGWGPILTQGNEAFAAGNYDEARRHYARAILDDPKDGYAKMLSAWTAFAVNDYNEAAAGIKRAITTSPDLASYPIDIRILYKDAAQFEGQVSKLQKVALEMPEDENVAFVLGYLHFSIGEPDRAIALFDKANASDPIVVRLRDGAKRGQEILKQREKQRPASKPVEKN